MKNLKNYAILLVIMVLAILFFVEQGVNASPVSIFSGANQTNNVTQLTAANSTTTTTTTVTNSAKVNTVNDASKDLPKTGENDVYIISAIGAAALVIGIVAYIKSRKYDIK